MKKLLFGMAALVLVTTTYAQGLEIKGGYDVWRNISKDYMGDSGGSIDQGWTLGAEYLWAYGEDYTYGVGTEFRSRIEDDKNEYNNSMPFYLVGKYEMLDEMFYLVGRGGYNASSNVTGGNTRGGHYVGVGVGRDLGFFNLEVLYENMGYEFKKEDQSGYHDSVGIKFGMKLGEFYDMMRQEAAPRRIVVISEEGDNSVIPENISVVEESEIIPVIVEEEPLIKYTLDHFEFNDGELSEKGRADLDKLKPEVGGAKKITATGHTDTRGSVEYNQKLSEERAQAVVDYLEIPEEVEVEVIGKGESMPLGEDHNTNRRVEIEIEK
ncbi:MULTISPECIES: OmpA family protein [Psychrilyobacter]|uniref:OmpA family protein n=1 Tax=Psychrilyobacter piezotolerans TaxID=2293438 RepID=A0ABX9KL63_9FUSO|nr:MULTISPECIES: OmpA family protein [Psychrilyobacter]MCS5421493.1 OmpA family protein [Psychrilyobacter sp. S5]NDI76531.1 OmpA family protein [Psychrilyobacter piezotolerans]RDE66122.1 OmpA family protein [Psychrilyobacter sp. S5]REI43300.1 OmpA family protein [Psychrilyobacter piezotolerans]